jgi:lipopolysaccharide/colanic/teichoic acid biosynthesis glycosyltransferase
MITGFRQILAQIIIRQDHTEISCRILSKKVGSPPDMTGKNQSNGRRPLMTRIRFQLISGLLIAVILPSLLRWGPKQTFLHLSSIWNAQESMEVSLAGSALAVIFGYVILRHVANYPSTRTEMFALPSFAFSYALLITLLLFFRLDYSRFQILLSFIFAVAWFAFIFLYMRRRIKIRLAVVPGGDLRNITKIPTISWEVLRKPDVDLKGVDGIVADLRADFSENWERFLAHKALQGLPVYHVKQLAESLTGRVEIEHLSENTFGAVVPNSFYLRLKHMGDFIFALIILPAFLLILLAAGLFIKISSRGPLFYTQKRVGYGGQLFNVYKLRTMAVPKPGEEGSAITEENDPRIIPGGKFLRKFRVDELPQIFNILKGEMSWIGPRPEAIVLSEWYESEIPYYSYRHTVRPGISGWAQVQQGHVEQVNDVKDKLYFDFYYIKNLSPWLDILIVGKTIKTILTGFGSK